MRAVFLNSGGGGNVRPSASRASIVASGIAPPSSLATRGSGYLRHGSHHRAGNPDRGLSPPPVSMSVQAQAAHRPIRYRRNLHGRARGVVRGRGPRLRHPFEVLHRALSLEGQRRQPDRLRHGRDRRRGRGPGRDLRRRRDGVRVVLRAGARPRGPAAASREARGEGGAATDAHDPRRPDHRDGPGPGGAPHRHPPGTPLIGSAGARHSPRRAPAPGYLARGGGGSADRRSRSRSLRRRPGGIVERWTVGESVIIRVPDEQFELVVPQDEATKSVLLSQASWLAPQFLTGAGEPRGGTSAIAIETLGARIVVDPWLAFDDADRTTPEATARVERLLAQLSDAGV